MTEFDTREKLSRLVPHKGKMLLLDRIVSFDLEKAQIATEVDVSDGCMFLEESFGGVPVWIAFEYMAQSVSALTGIFGLKTGTPPRMGFILSVTNFCAEDTAFPKGSTVRVEVRQTLRVDTAVTFEGKALVEGKCLAKATINAVDVENPKKVLGV